MTGPVKGERSSDHRDDRQPNENPPGCFQRHHLGKQRDDGVKGEIGLRPCDVSIVLGEFRHALDVREDMDARQVVRVIGERRYRGHEERNQGECYARNGPHDDSENGGL